jgi:hypothetical protein
VFGAMVTLWNDMRFAYGKKPMGFLNPFLYKIAESNPEAFYDVTTGNNVKSIIFVIMFITLKCCNNHFVNYSLGM